MEVFAAGYRFPKPSVAEFVLGDGFRPIVDASEYRITLDAEQFTEFAGGDGLQNLDRRLAEVAPMHAAQHHREPDMIGWRTVGK